MDDDIQVRRNAANTGEDSEWLLDAEQPHPYALRAHTADGWWRAEIRTVEGCGHVRQAWNAPYLDAHGRELSDEERAPWSRIRDNDNDLHLCDVGGFERPIAALAGEAGEHNPARDRT